jgi:hypothetical protein
VAIQADITLLIAAAGACYTAGSIVTKAMNGKHITKEVCELKEKSMQDQLTSVKNDVTYIRDSLDEMRGISKQ